MKRKLIVISLLLLLLVVIGCASAVAESGTYRDIDWNLTAGVLTLGNGDIQLMADKTYESSSNWPWDAQRTSILYVECNGTVLMRGNISYMFSNCSNMVSCDLSGCNTSAVSSVSSLFRNCRSLTTLNISSWDLSLATNDGYTFDGCDSLGTLVLGEHNPFILKPYSTNNPCYALLPVSVKENGVFYLSRWVHSSESYGSYLPAELCHNYTGDMQGTWVWEKVPTSVVAVYVEDDDSTLYIVESSSAETYGIGSNYTIHSVSGDDYTGLVYPFYGSTATWIAQKSNAKHIIAVDNVQMPSMSSFCSGFTACLTIDLNSMNIDGITDLSYLFKGCTALQSVDLSEWDFSHITSLAYMFSECKALNTLDLTGWSVENVTNIRNMFANATINCIDLTGWNVENVTNFEWLFGSLKCNSLTAPDLHFTKAKGGSVFYCAKIKQCITPNWSFGALTEFDAYGWAHCFEFDYWNAKDWNLDGIIYIYKSYRFMGTSSHTSVADLSGWHSNTVTDADYAFEYCYCATVTVTNWDMPALKDISGIFSFSSNVQYINGLSTWNVETVENFSYIFENCSSLKSVDVAHWNTANLKKCEMAFYNCSSLRTLDLSDWDLTNVESSGSMFNVHGGASNPTVKIESITIGPKFKFLSNCAFPTCTWASNTWEREDGVYGPFAPGDMYLNYTPEMAGTWIYGAVAYADTAYNKIVLFRSRGSINSRPLVDLDGGYHYAVCGGVETSQECPWYSDVKRNATAFYVTGTAGRSIKPISCKYWFYDASKLTECDMSLMDFSRCTTLSGMFEYCSALTEISTDGWDTSKVTDMSYLFYGCKQLRNLDVSTWDTSSVTNMYGMFSGCTALKTLNVSGMDTSHVTSTSYMFASSPSIEYLDLSSFDCSSVTSMYSMFYGCDNLAKVKLGNVSPLLGSGSQFATLPTPPETKDGVNYTQRWIREDGEFGPYTATELTPMYDGSMAGFWVWENTSGMYTIMFESAEEGVVGDWPNQFIVASDSYRIPKNIYRKFGYVIDHWEDGRGNNYEDNGVIPADTYAENNVVVLRAVMAPLDTSIAMQDGAFELTLHGGEAAYFDNLPTGTGYQVYEQSPEGWVLIKQQDTSGHIEYMAESNAGFVNQYTPGTVSVQLNGAKLLQGVPAEEGTYSFELLDENKELLQTTTVKTGGLVQFEPMEFTKDDIGLHQYYIREIPNDDPLIHYDVHEESIVIDVHENIGEPIVKHLSSANVDLDGNKLEDYIGYKYYTGVVGISGAKNLHVSVTHSNVRGSFYIWPGDYSGVLSSFSGSYNATFNPGLPGVKQISYVSGKDQELITDEFDLNSDSLSVVFYSSAYAPSQGYYPDGPYSDIVNYGYYITVSYEERELVAEIVQDQDGIVFRNDLKPGQLVLTKDGTGLDTSDTIFYYDVEFVYDNGQPYEVPESEVVYEPRSGQRTDYPDLLLPEEQPEYTLTVKQMTSLSQDPVVETFTYKAGDLFDIEKADNSGDYVKVVAGDEWLMPIQTGWKGRMPRQDITVIIRYYYTDATIDSSLWSSLVNGTDYSSDLPLRTATTFSRNIYVKTIDQLPSDAIKIDDGTSGGSIYLWEEGTDVYWWSDADDVYMASDCTKMFYNCKNLTSLDLSGLNTSRVTNMNSMFYNCISLSSLDVSEFDTSSVTDMSRMFSGNCRLTSLDLSNFNTSNVTTMEFMFYNCYSYFNSCGLLSINISGWDTSSVTTMNGMFEECRMLESLDVSGFNTSNVTNMSRMFDACESLTSLNVLSFDTHNVTTMNAMFMSCRGLTSIDLHNFDTQNVTDFSYMFAYDSGLTSLDVSNFDMSSALYLVDMFELCSGLTSLDLSMLNTATVVSMQEMFASCKNLLTIDLSGTFDTSSVTNVKEMFMGCLKLTTIYVGDSWHISGKRDYMFEYCDKLVGGSGTRHDENNVHSYYARVDNPPLAPGYLTYKGD